MKKIDLGQTIQILANLGVIAGIGFLAVELQQNNALLDAQARTSRAQIRIDAYDNGLNNSALLAAVLKQNSGEPLSELDRLLLRTEAEAMFTRWQYVFGEWRAGLIDDDDVPAGNWRYVFSRDAAAREIWDEIGEISYRPDFAAWMKENIVQP